MAGITLTLETMDPALYVPGVYPIRVTSVSDEDGLDPEIFVFHARSPQDALSGDQFECVASCQQMQELPVDAPLEDSEDPIPWYRKSVVEFYLLSPKDQDNIWDIIQSDTALLIKAFRRLSLVGNPEVVTIDPPA